MDFLVREAISEVNVVKVLFVCSGNICRSPTAQGVMQHLVAAAGLAGDVLVDSAGTGGWHVGEAPDPRSQLTALDHGIDLSHQQARKLTRDDFTEFDYLIAMDSSHRDRMRQICPPENQGRISLMLDHASKGAGGDVPDPYYGGDDGFELVFAMVEDACRGLLSKVIRDHFPGRTISGPAG